MPLVSSQICWEEEARIEPIHYTGVKTMLLKIILRRHVIIMERFSSILISVKIDFVELG